ncbi:MAG: hypothetical protein SGPRY_006056 [Prymnesium sp.]
MNPSEVAAACDTEGFVRLRRQILRRNPFTHKSTLERMFDSLRDVGVVKGSMQTGQLTTGTAPFNIFARIAAGLLQQPANTDTGWEGTEKENDKLGPEFKEKFMVACNRPENDLKYNDGTDEWKGKASMSKHHRFLIVKDLSWWTFNIAVYFPPARHRFGLKPDQAGKTQPKELEAALNLVRQMRDAAWKYVENSKAWSYHTKRDKATVGMFLHAYPYASVNSLHMHIVDLGHTGPTYKALAYKNLPVDSVLKVMHDEVKHVIESFLSVYDKLRNTLIEVRATNANGKLLSLRPAAGGKTTTIHGEWRVHKGRQIPSEADAGETLLIIAVRFAVGEGAEHERGRVERLIKQLLEICPNEFADAFVNARSKRMHTALHEVLVAARDSNKQHEKQIMEGKRPSFKPNLEMLSLLLSNGANQLLQDDKWQSALALSVACDFEQASKVLFAQLRPLLVDENVAKAAALSQHLNFQPFELIWPCIRTFPSKPGASLLQLVRLALSTEEAAEAVRPVATEVTERYKVVSANCSTVIVALLETLDTRQLYSLFVRTRSGTSLLEEACSSSTRLFNEVLASEQVFTTLDKRWQGELQRMMLHRHNRDGSLIPKWKVAILSLFFLCICVPLNLLLLLCITVYPPLKKTITGWLEKQGQINIFKARPLKLVINWRAIFLLNTPSFNFYIYITAQSFLALVFAVAPFDPTPTGWVWVLVLWSGIALVAEVNEVFSSLAKWEADWLNYFELPAILIAFAGAVILLLGGPLEFTLTARAVMSCMLVNVQALRLLQSTRQIGPLVLMLKSMLFDTISWAMLMSVTIISFSIGMYQAFEYSLAYPERDECSAVAFTESYTNHVPRMIISVLGGGEDYIMCFLDVSSSPTASIMMTVFLGLAVIILINMLIAMMAKTFDDIFEHSEDNYKVQRAKLYTSFSDSFSPAPINILSLPFWLYCRCAALSLWTSKPEDPDEPMPMLKRLLTPLCHVVTQCCHKQDEYEKLEQPELESAMLYEDLDSIEPALNDMTQSSAFTISKWNESDDAAKPVERAILPYKTTRWVDVLQRMSTTTDQAPSREDIDAVLAESLEDKTSSNFRRSKLSKHEVYRMLAQHVHARLTAKSNQENWLSALRMELYKQSTKLELLVREKTPEGDSTSSE